MLNKRSISKQAWLIAKITTLLAVIGGVVFASSAWAAATYVNIGTISTSVDRTVSALGTVFTDISIIAGLGFVTASFFKFHQHKQNPQQVQMSQGVSLLLIGCGLTLVPLLMPTASVSVLGAKGATNAKVGGKEIHNLIGSQT
ncbi:MAG: type IV secretion protein IcmD [Proteobacteria bacterium]|nr:type IV secretion protein IcmD [Pseudomonadota bacterium]